MKTLKFSERYLLSKRNLIYCLKLFSELEKYYYDPALDSILYSAYVCIPFFSPVTRCEISDFIYAHDLSAARRILSIYKKLFCRIPDDFFVHNVKLDLAFVSRMDNFTHSCVLDLSSRLLNNDQDRSYLFEVLHRVKLNFLTRLNRLSNGI